MMNDKDKAIRAETQAMNKEARELLELVRTYVIEINHVRRELNHRLQSYAFKEYGDSMISHTLIESISK